MSDTCQVCGRPLTDDASRAAGIGPVCADKLHPPRGRRPASPDQLTFEENIVDTTDTDTTPPAPASTEVCTAHGPGCRVVTWTPAVPPAADRAAVLRDAAAAIASLPQECKAGRCPGDAPDLLRHLADDAQQPTTTETETCRSLDVDGDPVLIRGAGDLTEQEQGYLADIVRAARRRHDAEPRRITYFIQSRPAPSQPWRQASGIVASWADKTKALDGLAYRRQMQPSWEHRLMQRTTTVTETPAP